MNDNHSSWFSRTIDRLDLALAIASLDGPEFFDSEYAESTSVVYDMWLHYKSGPDRRVTDLWQKAKPPANSEPLAEGEAARQLRAGLTGF